MSFLKSYAIWVVLIDLIMHFNCNKSMLDLVKELKAKGFIKSKRVEEAFLAIDRKDFLTPSTKNLAYIDAAQSIGYNATISAPHMHAYALETLKPALKPGSRCLDIGSGSGILVALFHKMVGLEGRVVGVEHIAELAKQSIKNLHKNFKEEYDKGWLKIIEGDGRLGYKQDAPYDCIHIGAAVKEINQTWIDQLKEHGMLMAPVDNGLGYQEITIVTKELDGKITTKKLLDVRYIPLTSKQKQWPGVEDDNEL